MRKYESYLLVWAAPGVVIMLVAFFTALRIGVIFGNDNFVRIGTFVICNLILWLLYAGLFQLLPQNVLELLGIGLKRLHKQSLETNATDEKTHADKIREEGRIATSVTPSYTERNEQYQREQEAARRLTIGAILDYTRHTMSPFVANEEELENLCTEIDAWSNDCQHKPSPIRLKEQLTTLELRHFVWNIGERLGTKNGYNGYVRADFIRTMFPDVFKDMEIDSIRNFKFEPDKGRITIDESVKGSTAFHTKTA